MLASDDQNPQFSGARNPDDILHVTFYMRSLQDNYKSEKEGRPIYYDVPFIRIQTPGNQLNIIDTEVREDHKIRFPRQWAAFQNQQQVSIIGTPLEEWPVIQRSRALELKAVKFYTVEQVAECSDLQLQSLGMDGHILRKKAQAYLAQAKDTAATQAIAAEAERLRQELKAKDEAHAKEMAELRALIEERTAPKPKRKYTRRQETQEQVSG